MKKTALITGITGQDGSYLAELLLEKGYHIIGLTTGNSNRKNVEPIKNQIEWVVGDCVNEHFVREVVAQYMPDEIYNLASVATVVAPWNDVIGTVYATALAPLHLLESIRTISPDSRFFQASSSEIYGVVSKAQQDETTVFRPHSPYGISKTFVHSMVGEYRRNFGLYVVSGILFNHESPRRGEGFITRKVTMALAKIKAGADDVLKVGNLDAKRDWGYAKEYVEAMWLMLQQEKPQDFVIATGETHSVRELIAAAAHALDMVLVWEGEKETACARDERGRVVVQVDTEFYRTIDSQAPIADVSKARDELGWVSQTSFSDLVAHMAKEDYKHMQEFSTPATTKW